MTPSDLMKPEDGVERLKRIRGGKRWDSTIILWEQAGYILDRLEYLEGLTMSFTVIHPPYVAVGDTVPNVKGVVTFVSPDRLRIVAGGRTYWWDTFKGGWTKYRPHHDNGGEG